MPGLTQTGKRMMIADSPSGRVAAFIYRTGMTDANSMRVLEKYGMDAHLPRKNSRTMYLNVSLDAEIFEARD